MKIGINLYTNWPYKEIIKAFTENNIRHTFVCADHPQLLEVMEKLDEAGITVDNFHAPYKGQNKIWEAGEEGEVALARYKESVDICVRYGIKLLIAHVSNGRPMPPLSEIGLSRFDAFLSYAKSKGITVAFENHRYVENVKYMLDKYPELGFCLDTAHEDAFTPGIRYLPMWGHRLVATHISDNDCVCDKDMHMIPYDGQIDFDKTAKELAACGYDGTLMLEIKPQNHEKYKDVSIPAYYAAAVNSIRRLAESVNEMKGNIEKAGV